MMLTFTPTTGFENDLHDPYSVHTLPSSEHVVAPLDDFSPLLPVRSGPLGAEPTN